MKIFKWLTKLTHKTTHDINSQSDDTFDICNYLTRDVLTILSQWKHECKYDHTVQFKLNPAKNSITIFTSCPGYLIGYHGEKVLKYTTILKERVHYINKVDFVETEFISV